MRPMACETAPRRRAPRPPLARPARRDRHGLEQLPPRDRPAARRPLPAHRLPEGDRAPRRRARRRRPADRGGARRAASTAWRRFAQPARRLRAAPGARGGDADAARGDATATPSWPRAQAALGHADRGHLRAARRRASSSPASRGCSRRTLPRLVDRHRRPLDRDDPRPRRAAARGPSRSRSAASACR